MEPLLRPKPTLGLCVRRSPDTGTKILGTACGVLLTAPVGLPHAYPLELEAVLEADPRQGKDGRDFAPHWIIAHADEELAAYHRRLISDRLGVRLAKPSFGAHVSILAGEAPRMGLESWGQVSGRRVAFAATHEVFTNGLHWWLRVRSAEFDALRAGFGLAPAGARGADGQFLGKDPFHLTVAKTHPADLVRGED